MQRREQQHAIRRVQECQPIGVLDPAEPQQQLQPVERELLRRQPGLDDRRLQRPEQHQHGRQHQQRPDPIRPSGTVAYTPAQIRDAYGINDLSEDGTGETIAIVDAYDDPDIFQAVDLFDSQFGATDSGPTLYDQYGPAASFLTVLNQSGQTTSLPSTDPSGVGTDNWEVEEELDVEWAHAMAPGRRSSWSRPTASRSPT